MGAVIVEAVRSAVGKRKGGLAGVHPADLSATVLNGLVERAGVDPSVVEDVIWGCVTQGGEQAGDIARTAALSAGWPETVNGVTIDRQCGSSQQALSFAVAVVESGYHDVVVAGGVESMTRVPMGSHISSDSFPYGEKFLERYDGVAPDQGVGAEMIAERWGFGRGQLDEFAVASHSKAAAAQDAGFFAGHIVPVQTPDGVMDTDEGIRRGSTVEALAGLKTPFKEGGVISAGNASQISDGSAAILVMSEEAAARNGCTPLARVHTATLAGDDPVIMLTAPIPATAKVLQKSGLSIDDIGVFEVNEAFASVPLAWLAETGADPARVNPNGGAIALGHPLGGSGARIMSDMIAHMRAQGVKYGLQTMCEGGGQANATIIELL
ncbi:MAG TPA: acetyl-CoA C-acyltransferase [Candidatus Dietzia intestinipullorum]|nr:acetyl-CoA C-acyltransferase [Candidatus Dietzia intestinipullorum]